MNYLLFSGSLRKASLNKKLIHVVNKIIQETTDNKTNVIDLQTLNLPVYDGDIESAGIPDGVKTLGSAIENADAIIISSPEYNGSIAGSLKNTIDWVSRLRPNPLEKKPILLMGASPGYFGSIRALNVSRSPFENMGNYLYPQSFALAKAGEAFNENGQLMDEGTQKRLQQLVTSFLEFAQKNV